MKCNHPSAEFRQTFKEYDSYMDKLVSLQHQVQETEEKATMLQSKLYQIDPRWKPEDYWDADNTQT